MTLLRQAVAVALVVVFSALARLHVFWAFGGRRGASGARQDTLFYSPLCVAISLGCLLLALGR